MAAPAVRSSAAEPDFAAPPPASTGTTEPVPKPRVSTRAAPPFAPPHASALGIPKPAYRVFELLHNLGDRRIPTESHDALLTKRTDGTLVLALWNYAEPDENAAPKSFYLQLTHSTAKTYTIQLVDPSHGSALAAWNAMGKPATPTRDQIAKLIDASKLAPPARHPITDPIRLEPQALALVVVKQ